MYLEVRLWSAFQIQKGLCSRESTFQAALNQQDPRSPPHENTRAGFSLHCVFYLTRYIFLQKICLAPSSSDFFHKTRGMNNTHICSEGTVICCSLQSHSMHGAIVWILCLFKCQSVRCMMQGNRSVLEAPSAVPTTQS